MSSQFYSLNIFNVFKKDAISQMFVIILMNIYAWKTYWRAQNSGYSLFGFKSWLLIFETVKQVLGASFPCMKTAARPEHLSQGPLEDSVRWCSSPTSSSSVQVSAPFLFLFSNSHHFWALGSLVSLVDSHSFHSSSVFMSNRHVSPKSRFCFSLRRPVVDLNSIQN